MSKKFKIGLILLITLVTVFGMSRFMPQEDMDISYKEKKEFVIDDKTLSQFIQVYGQWINGETVAANLAPDVREEIRMMLEDMGRNNTVKLRDVLKKMMDERTVDEVQYILHENMFEDQLNLLNQLLKK